MTPQDRQHQIDEIFVEASRQPPGQLDRYLDQVCRNLPAAVRLEIEQLLQSDKEVIAGRARFLDRMPVNIAHVLHLPHGADTEQEVGRQLGTPDVVHNMGHDETGHEGESTVDRMSSISASSEPDSCSVPMASGLPASIGGGRYSVRGTLGAGGQKQVYLAVDSALDREVVVSVINYTNENAQGAARFRHEARAMARLDRHPHIVRILDFGEENGHPYIVTEHLPGGSVAEMLREGGDRPLSVQQAIQFALETSEALKHAHQHGIVHRDIKPANLWLTEDGTVKLGDFGVAVSLDRSRLTETGVAIGTASYLSPEQALSDDAGPASDLYSLGVSLYEMVTGKPPFRGDTALSVVSQHLNAAPMPPSMRNSELGEILDSLILQLLAKRPEDRPGSAAAVSDALRTIAAAWSKRDPTQDDARSLRAPNRLAGGVFVGRENELQQLRSGLEEAVAGHGALFIIEGEAGSGKTRTAQELTTYARLRNVDVLEGRCYEGEGAPAFWPWMRIIRSYTERRDADQLVSVMGAGAADIAQLDREIGKRLPELPAPPSIEPEQARFRLFDSISTFLRQAGENQPLLIVLDDLQWADEPSLRLLSFLTGDLDASRLLVIGMYRVESVSGQTPMADTLGELSRERQTRRIHLPGLSPSEVARLISETAAVDPPRSLATAVWSKTEGNPFFVSEILRLLVAEGQLSRHQASRWKISIPQSVREVIARRLDRLSEDCNRILGLASVVGREFSFDVLRRVSDIPTRRILMALDDAVEARVLEEVPGEPVRHRYIHDLIRESIYDQLGLASRALTHERVGCALEEMYENEPERILSELAYHFFQAAQTGDGDKAIEYCQGAGQLSMERLAYEEAVRYFKMSLGTLQRQKTKNLSRRCQLLLTLAEAQRQSGQLPDAIESFRRAADDAKSLGEPEALAVAAIGLAEASWNSARINTSLVQLLKDALGAGDLRDSPLRAKLFGALSQGLRYLGSLDAAEEHGRAALEMARRVQDPAALAYVLYGELDKLWGSDEPHQGVACSAEMLRMAEATGDTERTIAAHMWLICFLLDVGDIEGVNASIQSHCQLSQQLRQPFNLFVSAGHLTMQALLEGRFDDAEKLAKKTVSLGNRLGADNAEGVFGLQMFSIRREQGRLKEIAPAVQRLVKRDLSGSVWGPGLAVIYAELGFPDHAKHQLEQLAKANFADIPRDALWNTCLSYLCDVCTWVGDARRAESLYRLLAPFAGRNVVVAGGVVCLGSADRFLGQLAATLRRWPIAEEHFQHAVEMNTRARARPWLAHAQFRYAEMLFARRASGDKEKGISLLRAVRATARQLGMRNLSSRVIELEATNA